MSIDIEHMHQNLKLPKYPLPGKGIKIWHISPLLEYCSAIKRINDHPSQLAEWIKRQPGD